MSKTSKVDQQNRTPALGVFPAKRTAFIKVICHLHPFPLPGQRGRRSYFISTKSTRMSPMYASGPQERGWKDVPPWHDLSDDPEPLTYSQVIREINSLLNTHWRRDVTTILMFGDHCERLEQAVKGLIRRHVVSHHGDDA